MIALSRVENLKLGAPLPVAFGRVESANFELLASKILAASQAHSCKTGSATLILRQVVQSIVGFATTQSSPHVKSSLKEN